MESRFVRLPWGLMHYFSGGLAEDRVHPIVLIHGLVIASRYMLPTARALVPLCSVYAVDLPGYGWSAKPRHPLSIAQLADALAEWMQALSIRQADFVGNSFGCQILASLAVRHPSRVHRLVLQGPTIDPEARSLMRQIGRLIQNSRRESPGLGSLMLRDYWQAGIRRIVATIRMALRDRIEERLPQITAPTLVVRGEHDPLVPERWASRVTDLLPCGKLVTLPGCAHTINYTAPDAFVRAMRPFLNL